MENPRLVSASLQKIKSIKNPIKHFFILFYFIKSETSDSFVNHFDSHFAYLKTLDFYFKLHIQPQPHSHEREIYHVDIRLYLKESWTYLKLHIQPQPNFAWNMAQWRFGLHDKCTRLTAHDCCKS